MNRQRLRLQVLALVALAASAAPLLVPSAATAFVPSPEAQLESSLRACTRKCSLCVPSTEHKNETGGSTHGGGPHSCHDTSPASCGDLHGCDPSFTGGLDESDGSVRSLRGPLEAN